MKIILALLLGGMIFAPFSAFGWKSVMPQNDVVCEINCNYGVVGQVIPSSTNFIILAILSTLGLAVYHKVTTMEKYQTFSLRCKKCGRSTQGLKCPLCEAKKQAAK